MLIKLPSGQFVHLDRQPRFYKLQCVLQALLIAAVTVLLMYVR
jgi:hypothetical protein